MANLNSKEIEIIKTLPQPFGFYRVLSGTNYLHFGFWNDEEAKTIYDAVKKEFGKCKPRLLTTAELM